MVEFVEGEFIDTVKVTDDVTLSVWRNPETGNFTAVDTMELPADRRWFYDAHTGQKIRIANTFTGLPK